jgi:hypothetical protein
MDIIDRAFTSERTFLNWDQLVRWLKAHAPQVNHVARVIDAAEQAQSDGLAVPVDADEAKWILKKYERLGGRPH